MYNRNELDRQRRAHRQAVARCQPTAPAVLAEEQAQARRGRAAEELLGAFMAAVEQLDIHFDNPAHRRLLEVYMASRERGFPAPRRKDGAA